MKYGKEIIQKYKAQNTETLTQIAELEKEIARIKTDIKEKEKDFSVKAVKERSDLMSELKNFEESLSRAKEHHAQMVIEYTPNALTEGLELVYQVKHDEQKNITGLVDEIETKIFEIVELYEEIETKDVEVLEGIETFVDELVPHLTKVRYNKRIKTPHEARGKHVSKNDHTPREIFGDELFTMRGQGLDILDVELKDNGIAGLIPPNKKLTDLYNEREIPKI